MKRRLVLAALWSLLGLALALPVVIAPSPPSRACGPYPLRARLWPRARPDVPLQPYLAGNLGLLDPRLDRDYLFVAYRYLSGLGLDRRSRATVADYFEHPAPQPYSSDPIQMWNNSRQRVPGAANRSRPIAFRSVEIPVESGVRYEYYLNCNGDAFLTAARTLEDRIDRWGADSPQVSRWLAAQDLVFANCQEGERMPEPPPAEWSPLGRADRAYQIAAAHFYAGRFADAERLFAAIGQDEASPWSATARYVVARAIIRQALVGQGPRDAQLARAADYLGQFLGTPHNAAWHPAAERLSDYVLVRQDPHRRRQELAKVLLAPTLRESARQPLVDYLRMSATVHDWEDGDDLALWLQAMRRSPANAEETLARWQQRRDLPWLVAALIHVTVGDSEAAELLEQAAGIAADHPVYPTLTYQRARLLAGLGHIDEARGLLDRLLENDSLSRGDRNIVLALRSGLAESLDEFLRLSVVAPVEVGYDTGSGPLIPDEQLDEASRGVVMPRESTRRIEIYFTPALMLDAVRAGVLPAVLNRRLALAAWTRAFVLNQDDVMRDLAPFVAELEPDLRRSLTTIDVTAAEDERRFVGAVALLSFPGLTPVLRYDVGRAAPPERIDKLRDNWWCPGAVRYPQLPALDPPPFLSAQQRADASEMRETIAGIDSGPNFLGRIVLDWAGPHPEDPRVPEALHLVVRATRDGCRAGKVGEVSHAAFELLHRRYPDSPWTAKTAYWYE